MPAPAAVGAKAAVTLRYSRAGVWRPSMNAAAMSAIAGLLATVPAAALEPTPARLDYQVEEGLNINRLLREDGVAAHLVLRSGSDPRILIAFPAGDSGVGVWFVHRMEK